MQSAFGIDGRRDDEAGDPVADRRLQVREQGWRSAEPRAAQAWLAIFGQPVHLVTIGLSVCSQDHWPYLRPTHGRTIGV